MNNQKGFSAVEAVLILVILGILGFVGWFVVSSNNKTDKNLKNAETSSNSTVTPKKVKDFVLLSHNDSSITYTEPSQIAKTKDQQAILEALHEQSCEAPNGYVAIYFQAFEDGEYKQDGNYASINSGCSSHVTKTEDGPGGGAVHFLHKDTSGNWILDAGTQSDGPPCEKVDGKGYPTTIIPKCYDNGNLRALKS